MFDNIFISGEASTFFADSASVDFWIGGNNLYKPGIWTWMDQTPFDFNDWDKGQPQNTSGNNCVAAQMQGGRWTADDCFIAKPFVCLTRDFSPTTTPSATTIRPKKCLDAWTFWNESCYKVLENSNWLDAEDRCKVDNGSHLVSIHSPEENLFVANLASYPGADICKAFPQGWIGLFTEDNGTHWKWTDGTPTNYLNWYPTNPIGSNTNFCVYMHLAPICNGKIGMFANGGSQCSGVMNRFICKMKPQ
uniref:C-type lectin domain-containing protein n=1 Tax=Panagrolaimus davidi TaxID=227884 RepID=A0A914QW41_9BILA